MASFFREIAEIVRRLWASPSNFVHIVFQSCKSARLFRSVLGSGRLRAGFGLTIDKILGLNRARQVLCVQVLQKHFFKITARFNETFIMKQQSHNEYVIIIIAPQFIINK